MCEVVDTGYFLNIDAGFIPQLTDFGTVIVGNKEFSRNTKEGISQFSPIGIPSDGTQPEEEVINGITMVTLKEDDQFSATFIYQNTVYVFFSRDLNYDECYKVVSSLAAVKE